MAEPKPMVNLIRRRNQNSGLRMDRMLAPMQMQRPKRNTFFIPRILANLAAGTMLTTDPSRNTVFT